MGRDEINGDRSLYTVCLQTLILPCHLLQEQQTGGSNFCTADFLILKMPWSGEGCLKHISRTYCQILL